MRCPDVDPDLGWLRAGTKRATYVAEFGERGFAERGGGVGGWVNGEVEKLSR